MISGAGAAERERSARISDSTLRTWGEFAAGLRIDEVPDTARHRLRLQTCSVLAATFTADLDPGARRVTSWARRTEGPHPLLPTGEGVGRLEAIVASAARSCALHYDDYALAGHTGHSAVVVPLVLGAAADFSWDEYQGAQAAAGELGARLGLAALIGPQSGPSFANPLVHAVSAAAATARVLRLDAKQTAHALALSLAHPATPLPLSLSGAHDARIIATSSAALAGVLAAELAFEGVTGPLDLLDHPRGFFDRFAFVPARGALGSLRRFWLSETIHIKQHPGAAFFQTAIDAASEVAAQAHTVLGRPLAAADVRSVDVETTFLGAAVDAHARRSSLDQRGSEGELPRWEVMGSLALTTALSLLHGTVRPAALTDAALSARASEVRTIAACTRVRHAWDLSSQVLWRAAAHLSPAEIFRGNDLGDLLLAPMRVRRSFPALEMPGIPTAQMVTEAMRAFAAYRSGRRSEKPAPENALRGFSFPFATRLRVELVRGVSLGADRVTPRGAPGGKREEGESLARTKLIDAAAERLGPRRARKLADMILDPPSRLRVRDVIEALRRH